MDKRKVTDFPFVQHFYYMNESDDSQVSYTPDQKLEVWFRCFCVLPSFLPFPPHTFIFHLSSLPFSYGGPPHTHTFPSARLCQSGHGANNCSVTLLFSFSGTWGGGTHEFRCALCGSLSMSLALPESPKFRKAELPWTWLHFTSLGHIKMDMLEPGDGGCPKIPRPSYPCRSWCPLLWRLQPFPWPWLLRWSCWLCDRGDSDKWQWQVMLPPKGRGVPTSCHFSRDWRVVVLGEVSL